MKCKDLAKILLQFPDADVSVIKDDIFVGNVEGIFFGYDTNNEISDIHIFVEE